MRLVISETRRVQIFQISFIPVVTMEESDGSKIEVQTPTWPHLEKRFMGSSLL